MYNSIVIKFLKNVKQYKTNSCEKFSAKTAQRKGALKASASGSLPKLRLQGTLRESSAAFRVLLSF